LNGDTGLGVGEDLLVGSVVFRLMRMVMTPPAVSVDTLVAFLVIGNQVDNTGNVSRTAKKNGGFGRVPRSVHEMSKCGRGFGRLPQNQSKRGVEIDAP
jgi:hypothetical protein